MKKVLLILSMAFALACSTLVPTTSTPIPTVTVPPSPTATLAPTATATDMPPTGIPSPTSDPTGFTRVRIVPFDGDLAEQLAAHAKKAALLKQMPVIEFDALW